MKSPSTNHTSAISNPNDIIHRNRKTIPKFIFRQKGCKIIKSNPGQKAILDDSQDLASNYIELP
jgi:hypothetical protein